MIITLLLLIVIVLGGSVLYMLNRLRTIDETILEIKQSLRVKATMDDCYAVSMEVIKKEIPTERQQQQRSSEPPTEPTQPLQTPKDFSNPMQYPSSE